MRRWVLRVACWVALAGIAQLICAVWMDNHSRGFTQPIMRAAAQGTTWPEPSMYPAGWQQANPWSVVASTKGVPWSQSPPPPVLVGCVSSAWSEEERFQAPGARGDRLVMSRDRVGWPARCLYATFALAHYEDMGSYTAHDRVELPRWVFEYTRIYAMPRHVIWSGVVINTVCYTPPIALLWVAPGVAFRAFQARRRRRRLPCVHCGYPIGDAARPCPECGKDTKG